MGIGMEFVRQGAAIALVFGLLWAALWALRRKSAGRLLGPNSPAAREQLQSRGRLALTAQHSVHWVRIGQRDFVLGVHPSGITLLGDATSGAPAEGRDK